MREPKIRVKSLSPFLRCVATVLTMATLASSALAQSVGDYQLPSPTGSASSRAQGPTDPENPAATPRPATEAPRASPNPAPTPTPAPIASPASSPSPQPVTKAAPPAARPAPSPRVQSRAAAPAASTTPSPIPTAIGAPPPAPETTLPEVVPSTAPASAGAPRGPVSNTISAAWRWLGGGAAALAAVGIVFALLRRRRRRSEERDENDQPPAFAADSSAPATPAAPPSTSEPAPDRPPLAIPQPAFATTDTLDIALDAARLSATLVNTALDYRLLVANIGVTRIESLVIEADMIGAHASLPVEAQLASEGLSLPERHRIEGLAPDETLALAGTIRLPLADIRAIRQGSAALFIPLVRLRLFARDGERLLRLARTWVIGEGETLPGAGLRPFRLDLGPRVYPKVDQRQL